jgi:hypothetical protein
MITQCCECKKVRQGDRWVAPSKPVPTGESVSHGYCPVCAKKALKAVEEHYAQLLASRAAV